MAKRPDSKTAGALLGEEPRQQNCRGFLLGGAVAKISYLTYQFEPGRSEIQAPGGTKFIHAHLDGPKLQLRGLIPTSSNELATYSVYCLRDHEEADVSEDQYIGTVVLCREIFAVFVVEENAKRQVISA